MADYPSLIRTIIPAAGSSMRFQAAGYTTPKPLLKVRHGGVYQHMYQHVRDRLPLAMQDPARVFLGLPGMSRWMGDVTCGEVLRTAGQADTILQMLEITSTRGPVLLLNCDVLLPTVAIESLIQALDANDFSVAVQMSSNSAMSYVDKLDAPTFFAEKRPISEWAMAGAWAFRHAEELQKALREVVQIDRHGAEPYLSHALNHMTGPRSTVVVPVADITDWGTPQALAASGAEVV